MWIPNINIAAIEVIHRWSEFKENSEIAKFAEDTLTECEEFKKVRVGVGAWKLK